MLAFPACACLILVFTRHEFLMLALMLELMLELILALLVKTRLKWEPAAAKLTTHTSKLNAGNKTDWGLKSPSPLLPSPM